MEQKFSSDLGKILLGDALEFMRANVPSNSVDLVITSPPFALLRKKDYGNVEAEKYLDWFRDFALEFLRVLKPEGSFVLDIGGSWIPGQATRSLYHFELLIMLVREIGFHLAQEFYWWNPSKLPTPAEWVNIRRIRVKDAVNCVFWLSKTPWPKASNRRVLVPYSDSMEVLLENGYKPKLRPSGHDISSKFSRKNRGSIPPNLLAFPNTESNSHYLNFCKENGINPHPARFPSLLPEYFVRMLTEKGDLVFDPFGGSCVTGEVCERLSRKWICTELDPEYLDGALGRFADGGPHDRVETKSIPSHYHVPNPAVFWANGDDAQNLPLPEDGGKKRPSP
jgi:DNA modification methylase